jgi:hypothetical protein
MRDVVTGIDVLHLVGQQAGLGVGGEGVDVLHMVGKQVRQTDVGVGCDDITYYLFDKCF